jgi:histidinol dehydrogenase
MQARPLRLSTAQADFETLFQQRLHWSADADAAIEQRVADILADVKARATPQSWNTPSVSMA